MGYCTVAACTGRVLKQINKKRLPVENARASTLNLKVHSESREYRVFYRSQVREWWKRCQGYAVPRNGGLFNVDRQSDQAQHLQRSKGRGTTLARSKGDPLEGTAKDF